MKRESEDKDFSSTIISQNPVSIHFVLFISIFLIPKRIIFAQLKIDKQL